MPIPLQDTAALVVTLQERRARIAEDARCRFCHSSRLDCRRLADEDRSAPFGCCSECNHDDRPALIKLVDEIESGEVRTVAETEPRQGPRGRPSWMWLLDQEEWWAPKVGSMIRVVNMTDTHRWHTVRMLERNAHSIAMDEHWRMGLMAGGPLGPGGDMACDAFEREMGDLLRYPLEFLRSRPLYEALARRLPTPHAGKRSRRRWGRMVQRARHYSTCPRNRDLKADECTCRVGQEA
jgi:hypothetical protein